MSHKKKQEQHFSLDSPVITVGKQVSEKDRSFSSLTQFLFRLVEKKCTKTSNDHQRFEIITVHTT